LRSSGRIYKCNALTTEHVYVLALGSNRPARHGRTPRAMVAAATRALADEGVEVIVAAPVIDTAPIGPALRRFANSVLIVRTHLSPPALLLRIKDVERSLGRRRGQRWGNRPIDIDIILWSGGLWHDRTLSIPHPAWRHRRFVLEPITRIAPDWRDPVSALTARQLLHRLRR
jgi:2-amino-4-hydroxy-6-hydroxymethyldihydropteridine diphosphokinase